MLTYADVCRHMQAAQAHIPPAQHDPHEFARTSPREFARTSAARRPGGSGIGKGSLDEGPCILGKTRTLPPPGSGIHYEVDEGGRVGFVDQESCVLPSVLAEKEGRAHKDCGEGESGVNAAEDARMLRSPPTITSPMRTHAHTSASASIRQHTAICPPPTSPLTTISFEEQRCSANAANPAWAAGSAQSEFATSSSREHTSASASICQHTAEFVRPFIRDEAVESPQQIDANGSGEEGSQIGGRAKATPPSSESGGSGGLYEEDFEDVEDDVDFEDVEKEQEEEEEEEESGGVDKTMDNYYYSCSIVVVCYSLMLQSYTPTYAAVLYAYVLLTTTVVV